MRAALVLFALASVALFALASVARAEPLVDRDLSIDLSVPGATTCWRFPEHASDERACAPVPRVSAAQIAQLKQGDLEPIALVAFVLPDWKFVLVASTQPFEHAQSASPRQVYDLAQGFEQGVKQAQPSARAHGTADKSLYDLIHRGGRPIVRMQLDLDTRGTREPDRRLQYFVFGADRLYSFSFVTDAAHVAEVQKLADALFDRAHLPAGDFSTFHRDRAYRAGRYFGRLFAPIVLLLLVIGVTVVFLQRRDVRRKS